MLPIGSPERLPQLTSFSWGSIPLRHLTAAALVVIERQLGAISIRQLHDADVARRGVQRLLADGVLEHVGHSVLRTEGARWTVEARLVVLCLQHPRGFVTGPTLGSMMGLRRMPYASKLHFSVPHGYRFDAPNHVQLRQSRLIAPDHTRQLDNGLVVASAPRLAFDLAADLSRPDLASVIEQLLHQRLCGVEELAEVAQMLCARGRRGSRSFAEVLVHRHAGSPAESHPELQVLEGLLRLGVPVEPQLSGLVLPNGDSIRIDMAVPRVQWAVEVDVHPSHLDLVGTTKDKRRDRQLHLLRWQVERVTAIDMLNLRGTLGELRELYRKRVTSFIP